MHLVLYHHGHICYQWQAMWNQAQIEIKPIFKVTLNWTDRNTTHKKEKEMDFYIALQSSTMGVHNA